MSRLDTFRAFVGPAQRQAIYSAMQGEEGQYFRDMVGALIDRLQTMPETYAQDGMGDQAVVHLHYFTGSGDWYITEKDGDQDGEGQIQAFGLADLGYGAELGYISIAELIASGVELDLHFKPQTLAELKDTRQAAAPELLRALELAVATIQRLERHAPGSQNGTLDVARAAIAHAEGKS